MGGPLSFEWSSQVVTTGIRVSGRTGERGVLLQACIEALVPSQLWGTGFQWARLLTPQTRVLCSYEAGPPHAPLWPYLAQVLRARRPLGSPAGCHWLPLARPKRH